MILFGILLAGGDVDIGGLADIVMGVDSLKEEGTIGGVNGNRTGEGWSCINNLKSLRGCEGDRVSYY